MFHVFDNDNWRVLSVMCFQLNQDIQRLTDMPSGLIKYNYYSVVAELYGGLLQEFIHCFSIAAWAYHSVTITCLR